MLPGLLQVQLKVLDHISLVESLSRICSHGQLLQSKTHFNRKLSHTNSQEEWDKYAYKNYASIQSVEHNLWHKIQLPSIC